MYGVLIVVWSLLRLLGAPPSSLEHSSQCHPVITFLLFYALCLLEPYQLLLQHTTQVGSQISGINPNLHLVYTTNMHIVLL